MKKKTLFLFRSIIFLCLIVSLCYFFLSHSLVIFLELQKGKNYTSNSNYTYNINYTHYGNYTYNNNNSNSNNNNSWNPTANISMPKDKLIRLTATLNNSWTITWSASSTNFGPKSRIGLYYYGEEDPSHFVSYFSTGGPFEGSQQLPGPDEAGLYEFKYFKDDISKTLATLGPILINYKSESTYFNISALETNPLDSVILSWNIKELKEQNSQIYICLSVIGVYDICILKEAVSQDKGSINVIMPPYAGYFIFRMMKESKKTGEKAIRCLYSTDIIKNSKSNFALKPSSKETVIAGVLSADWSVDEPDSTDWIGIYNINQGRTYTKSSTPLRNLHTDGQAKGTFHSILPPNSQAGQFLFVYFHQNLPVAVSDLIDAQQPAVTCSSARKTMSKIKHLVIICTENHSFDSYYGEYCQAEPFSNPVCQYGPTCCERPPDMVQGFRATPLTDSQNLMFDPDHMYECEECEIAGGDMSRYVSGCYCSNLRNFAVATPSVVSVVHNYAREYALADHFFHAVAGASCMNNMYLARASFVFNNNDKIPLTDTGTYCNVQDKNSERLITYYDPSITSLLAGCGFQLKTYAEGYNYAKKHIRDNPCYPHGYDASDIPFIYYTGIMDNTDYIDDFSIFSDDLSSGKLPEVSYVKPLGKNTGHPGCGTITSEQMFIQKTVDMVFKSQYAKDTLILWLPDESGGYYDHVWTPKNNKVDDVPYGPRVPLLAIGEFAKKNYISHVEMEHSSIVKFIEWNWLSGQTGHLQTRDRDINNILDLLDADIAEIKNIP